MTRPAERRWAPRTSATLTLTNDDTGGGIQVRRVVLLGRGECRHAHRHGDPVRWSGERSQRAGHGGRRQREGRCRLRSAVTERARHSRPARQARPLTSRSSRTPSPSTEPESDVEAPEPRRRRHAELAEHGDAQHHQGRHPVQPNRLHGQRGAGIRDDHGQPRRERRTASRFRFTPWTIQRSPPRTTRPSVRPRPSRAARRPRPSPWRSRTTRTSL